LTRSRRCGIVAFVRRIENPPNPYNRYSAEFIGEAPPVKLEVFEETATKTIITKAFASDWEGGWRYTVNCYRGCIHGCTYCFARRYHEYLGYGAGTDFETKIVVKPRAPELLRFELKKLAGRIPHLDFSFATDPYIPLEAEYNLTRRCLEVCVDFRIPVTIVTKSPLVVRDIDVLKRLKKVSVYFSLPFLSKEKSNPFEPFAPVPEVRFRAMARLAEKGIETGIAIAPLIPGYNEPDIPRLLERAKECGARRAFVSLLHIDTDSIEQYFLAKMREKLSEPAVRKIMNAIRRERGGSLRHRTYKERLTGQTEQWAVARRLFEFQVRRLGLATTQSPTMGDNEVGEVATGPSDSAIAQPSLFG